MPLLTKEETVFISTKSKENADLRFVDPAMQHRNAESPRGAAQTCPTEVLCQILQYIDPASYLEYDSQRDRDEEHPRLREYPAPETTDLASWSACCRAWSDAARPLLFRRACITSPKRGQELASLIEHDPAIAHWVRDVLISCLRKKTGKPRQNPYEHMAWLGSAQGRSLLCQLSQVTTLVVRETGRHHVESPFLKDSGGVADLGRMWESLFCLRSVTFVQLFRCTLPTEQALMQIVTGAYPSLQTILMSQRIHIHNVSPNDALILLDKQHYSPVRRMHHHNEGGSLALNALVGSVRCHHLQELSLQPGTGAGSGPAGFEYAQVLVDHAPDLRKLVLDYRSSSCPPRTTLNLRSNAKLQHLAFQNLPGEDPDMIVIAHVINTLPLPLHLRHLQLRENMVSIPEYEWIYLDRYLTQPQFACSPGHRTLELQDACPHPASDINLSIRFKTVLAETQAMGWFNILSPYLDDEDSPNYWPR